MKESRKISAADDQELPFLPAFSIHLHSKKKKKKQEQSKNKPNVTTAATTTKQVSLSRCKFLWLNIRVKNLNLRQTKRKLCGLYNFFLIRSNQNRHQKSIGETVTVYPWTHIKNLFHTSPINLSRILRQDSTVIYLLNLFFYTFFFKWIFPVA